MKPYAELLEFNQPNPIRLEGYTRIRDAFRGLKHETEVDTTSVHGSVTYPSHAKFYDPERIMEFAGRGDYGEKNQRRLGETYTRRILNGGNGFPEVNEEASILKKYIDMNHQSMIEFGWATFYMEFSRVVLAELTRHRLASYQVESQRFVKYEGGTKVADVFFMPDGFEDIKGIHEYEGEVEDWGGGQFAPVPGTEFEGLDAQEAVEAFYQSSYELYLELREKGVSPQEARYVLPNGFKTRMCMSANVREWRHIIQLRLDKSAQPEMRELMQQVYDQLVMVFPNALHGVQDGGRGIR